MIYLIGGMPRVGKSTLAQMILERNKISWMPLDTVREALGVVSKNLGIYDGDEWWASHHEKFFPFLKELVKSTQIARMSYVLEGDSFFPEHIDRLSKEFTIKGCFLGVSNLNVDILKKHKGAGDPWLDTITEEKLNSLPSWIMGKSQEYKKECEKYGIKYFDVSENHKQTLEEAYRYLLGDINQNNP